MTNPICSISPTIDALPWQPVSPGFHTKVVRGSSNDDDTRVVVLHLEPGTVVPRHLHLGEVHAFNLAGTRKLHTGEVIGPGEYVYEPPGNIDSWMAIGDVPVVIFVTVRGAIEYLDEQGVVTRRMTTSSATASYRDFVAKMRANG